ncbi:MAG: GntR family transcriptional regulator [Lentisphaeria bacterium]|nr:GntR family transcriptional regulator [Lentisphaeria bacterium]
MNKSQMLQDMILNEICTGRWKPGDPIPSRNQLCRKYRCSRNTVERAVSALKQRGCLISNQGGATRVASPACCRVQQGLTELFVVSGNLHEHSERSIRELFFPDLESAVNVRAIRESDLLRHMDTVSRPGSAMIWVTPDIVSLSIMAYLERANVPQLLINRSYLHYNFAGTDATASIRKGLEWLCSLAGTECALVSGCADLSMPYLSERLIAFYETAARLGMTPPPDWIHVMPIHDLPAQVSEIGSRLFAAGKTPRGITVLDSRLTVPLVTIGHMYGKTPGRDYFLLTYDFHPELFKCNGIGMLRQQNEKIYLESQRWLREGYAEKRAFFRSSIPAELIAVSTEASLADVPFEPNPCAFL